MSLAVAPEASWRPSGDAVCSYGSHAVAALNSEWQAACDRTEGTTVFQTAHWLRAWCDAVAARECATPIIIRVPAVGPLRLGIALQLSDESGALRLRPLSSPWADYHDAVGNGSQRDVEEAASAFEGLALRLGAEIVLDDIRQGGVLAAVCTRLGGVWVSGTPVCKVDLLDPLHLGRVTGRAEYRAKRRRLERRGALELVHNRSQRDVLAALPCLIELHERQWSDRNAVAPFTEAGVAACFTAVAAALSVHRMLDLTELRLGGQTLAAYYGFIYKGVYYAYRTAFDASYFAFSPGHLMLQALLKDCAEEGLSAFDLMRGDYAYKTEYASSRGCNLTWRSVAGTLR